MPLRRISPFTSSSCVGFVVPIPINPLDFTFRNVPPVPTTNPVPIVKIPTELWNTNPAEVAKSLLSLNKTLPLFPGGETVMVAAIPNVTACTAILFPTKLSWVMLLKLPTRDPSSNTLIDPGINPPLIGTQYLWPG